MFDTYIFSNFFIKIITLKNLKRRVMMFFYLYVRFKARVTVKNKTITIFLNLNFLLCTKRYCIKFVCLIRTL